MDLSHPGYPRLTMIEYDRICVPRVPPDDHLLAIQSSGENAAPLFKDLIRPQKILRSRFGELEVNDPGR